MEKSRLSALFLLGGERFVCEEGNVQAFFRACFYASAAADTFRRMRDFTGRKVHRTGFLASSAGGAGLLLPGNLYKAEPVKPSIDGSQRTEILTKGTINLYRKQKEEKKNSEFPEKQSPNLASKGFIDQKKRHGSHECAGGAQIFAECGNFGIAAK